MKLYTILISAMMLTLSMNIAFSAEEDLLANSYAPNIDADTNHNTHSKKVDGLNAETNLSTAFANLSAAIDQEGEFYQFKPYKVKTMYGTYITRGERRSPKRRMRPDAINLKKFAMVFPDLSNRISNKIGFEIATSVNGRCIILRPRAADWELKHNKLEKKQLVQEVLDGSRTDQLFAWETYFLQQINEMVQNKIDRSPISQTERETIINSLVAKLEKAARGTVYENVSTKEKTAHFVDQLFLDRSLKDARLTTQSLEKTLDGFNKPPASLEQQMNLMIMRAGNPNWKSSRLKDIMDIIGISPGAGGEKTPHGEIAQERERAENAEANTVNEQETIKPNIPPVSDNTKLFEAAKDGNMSKIRKLIHAGYDLNAVDENGATPFCIALQNGRKQAAQELMVFGSDKNHKDNNGRTPLHYAAIYGAEIIVGALLQSDVDASAKDKTGKTARDWAIEKNNNSVIKMMDVYSK